MYEDHTIEERYLHNFSAKEKKEFYRQHRKWVQHMGKYAGKVMELICLDSPAIFANCEPEPNTFLDIKYILNRIAANDPRDTDFELGAMDPVLDADRLALDIARAFRNNTNCKKVILNKIGLTDNGMLPILYALRTKKLDLLDIGNNKLADKSVQVLDDILSDSENKWEKVNLGKIRVNAEQKKALEKHEKLSFVPVFPAPILGGIFRNLCQKQ